MKKFISEKAEQAKRLQITLRKTKLAPNSPALQAVNLFNLIRVRRITYTVNKMRRARSVQTGLSQLPYYKTIVPHG
jgi:hypothetical protein